MPFIPVSSSKFVPVDEPKPSPSYGGKKGLKSLGLSGPVGYFSENGSEDVLPTIGQTIGAEMGGMKGAIAGEIAGDYAKRAVGDVRSGNLQRFKSLAISPESYSAQDPVGPGVDAAITAGTEGIMRGLPNFYFRKQLGGEARQLAGEKLGEVANAISEKAPFANMAKNPIIDEIESGMEAHPFERGPAKSGLANIKKQLVGMDKPLTFDQARELEQQLGREAQFATDATQGHFTKAPKAPQLNSVVKALRNRVSNSVDQMAADAGYPEYKDLSSEYADLMKKYPESELQRGFVSESMKNPLLLAGEALGGIAGIGATMANHPVLGIPLGIASTLSTVPPNIRTAIFRNIIRKPVTEAASQAARSGISEALKRVSESSRN